MGVFAGGEGDELVAILGGETGVVIAQLLTLVKKVVKGFFIRRINKIVIGKVLSLGCGDGKHTNDLVQMPLLQRIKPDVLVILPEISIVLTVFVKSGRERITITIQPKMQ